MIFENNNLNINELLKKLTEEMSQQEIDFFKPFFDDLNKFIEEISSNEKECISVHETISIINEKVQYIVTLLLDVIYILKNCDITKEENKLKLVVISKEFSVLKFLFGDSLYLESIEKKLLDISNGIFNDDVKFFETFYLRLMKLESKLRACVQLSKKVQICEHLLFLLDYYSSTTGKIGLQMYIFMKTIEDDLDEWTKNVAYNIKRILDKEVSIEYVQNLYVDELTKLNCA
jgi:hypothetical protein